MVTVSHPSVSFNGFFVQSPTCTEWSVNLEPLNTLTPMSEHDRISLYNINTISTRQVTRIKKNVNLGIIRRSNAKFSELTL